MYLVTSNEKSDLTSWQRRQDVQAIYDGLPAQPIVLWQEFRKQEFHDDIKAKVPAGTYHAFGDLPIPVSVPARYSVLEERWTLAKPWTGATVDGPGLGPVGDWPRYFAVLKLQDTDNPLMPPFYVINTHYTNGCEWDSTDPSATALALRPYWTGHWDLMKAEIDAIKNSDSTVFWGGDFNRKNSPAFGSAEKLAVGDGKIDKLAVIDRSVDTVLKTTGTIVTLSDHDARWAKWDLSRRP